MPRTSRLALTLAALAVTGPALAACSGQGGPDGHEGPGATLDVDAASYYEDYESGIEADGGVVHDAAAPEPEATTGPPPADPGPRVPGPDEGNTFRAHGASGFVDAARDPRSTFALDVDTGSLGVARTLLRDGHRVPPASVRVEEWVNGFEYGDHPPTDGDLGLTAETGAAPSLDDGTQLVRVAVAAREVAADERPRANVTLVVDRSGSMDIRERLGLVQSSLAVLAERLDPDDTVSVVSFDDRGELLLPPTEVRDQAAILDAVEELQPGGGTNLEAGLRLGYRQAREAFDPEAVNVVVLASDGVANIGRTGPGSIADTIEAEGADGIHLVTVGYGMGNYNDHLMEQLADRGDGFYSYVDTFAEAASLFGTELVTTLTPVAADARAQVRFDPQLVSSYRQVGYDNRALADDDFTDPSVDAGELGAGHQATALYEVRLADGVEPGAVIGEAAVRWTPAGTGGPRGPQQERVVELQAASADAEASPDLQLAAAVADLAQLLGRAEPYADRAVTVADVRERADALSSAGVPGAAELERLAEQALAVE